MRTRDLNRSIVFIALLAGLSWTHAQDNRNYNRDDDRMSSDNLATMRLFPLDAQPEPPRIANVVDTDVKRERIHPMQPPTIPHRIDNYQVDRRANRCLSCHSRTRVSESRAPMVSVTHYVGRDGEVLAEVSPRRYFCTQCHVPQTDARPLVENTFRDVTEILGGERGSQ